MNLSKRYISNVSPSIMMLYITFVLISLITTNKIIRWDGIDISACVFIFPFLYFFCDIVAEVYGLKTGNNMIWYAFISCILFSLVTLFIINIPSKNIINDQAYFTVLGNELRFTISGMLSLLLGLLINNYLITKWKILTKSKYFVIRSIGATTIGEFFNTFLAISLGFWGFMPLQTLISMILVSFIIKTIYAVILAYPGLLVATYLKNARSNMGIDDNNFSFNPFTKL